MENGIPEINFGELLDLRVDYAFKGIFAALDNKQLLISLLNAIFGHSGINREIKDLTVTNPYLDKQSIDDKLSIIDIIAELADNTVISIEMHLYGLPEFKNKTLHTWARIFSDTVKEGETYTEFKPVICISLIDGAIRDANHKLIKGIHTLFQIMERDSHILLTQTMELHYVNMEQFVRDQAWKADENGKVDMFTKWLTLFTQNDIDDKTIIKKICQEEAVINMAVEALARFSADDLDRFIYKRRIDELRNDATKTRRLIEAEKQIAETKRQVDEAKKQADEAKQQADEAKQQVDEAKRKVDEEKQQADEAKRQANEEKQRADEAKQQVDETAGVSAHAS